MKLKNPYAFIIIHAVFIGILFVIGRDIFQFFTTENHDISQNRIAVEMIIGSLLVFAYFKISKRKNRVTSKLKVNFDTKVFDTNSLDNNSYDPNAFDTISFDNTSSDTNSFDTLSFDNKSSDDYAFDKISLDNKSSDVNAFDPQIFDPKINELGETELEILLIKEAESHDNEQEVELQNIYTQIFNNYVELSLLHDNLEAMKRALFLSWYKVSDNSIGNFENDKEMLILGQLNTALAENRIGEELELMLCWYFIIADFNFEADLYNYPDIKIFHDTLKNKMETKSSSFSQKVIKNLKKYSFENRGLMGIYFESVID